MIFDVHMPSGYRVQAWVDEQGWVWIHDHRGAPERVYYCDPHLYTAVAREIARVYDMPTIKLGAGHDTMSLSIEYYRLKTEREACYGTGSVRDADKSGGIAADSISASECQRRICATNRLLD